MSFLKHIGRHGDRKIALLFREVPNEEHMCLVIYPDTLPAPWEAAIMKALESDVGQQAEQFADALHRSFLPDGRVILDTLHREKMIKKIRTADVLITPRSDSTIRLDELNKMLNEMKQGEAAIKKLAENDAARGMVAPETKRAAEAAFKNQNQPTTQPSSDGALSDRQIAANMLTQAQRMEAEGKGLLNEAARMRKDAERMDPGVVASNAPTTSTVVNSDKPRRGRPPKNTVAEVNAA
jgi:hypothetical protein